MLAHNRVIATKNWAGEDDSAKPVCARTAEDVFFETEPCLLVLVQARVLRCRVGVVKRILVRLRRLGPFPPVGILSPHHVATINDSMAIVFAPQLQLAR